MTNTTSTVTVTPLKKAEFAAKSKEQVKARELEMAEKNVTLFSAQVAENIAIVQALRGLAVTFDGKAGVNHVSYAIREVENELAYSRRSLRSAESNLASIKGETPVDNTDD